MALSREKLEELAGTSYASPSADVLAWHPAAAEIAKVENEFLAKRWAFLYDLRRRCAELRGDESERA
jgi:hypothetical protein